jgi:hypothetical protein
LFSLCPLSCVSFFSMRFASVWLAHRIRVQYLVGSGLLRIVSKVWFYTHPRERPNCTITQSRIDTIAQSRIDTIAQSHNRTIAQSHNRTIAQSHNRSIVKSRNRSLAHSLTRSLAHSLNRAIVARGREAVEGLRSAGDPPD